MSLIVITPPTAEPVSVDEARAHRGGLGDDVDDSLLEIMIVAARERAEHELQRSVAQKTYELSLDEFPSGTIELPMAPIVPGTSAMSITSVKYTDLAGAEQTLDPSAYLFDGYSHTPRLSPVSGWPSAKVTMNAVRVRYVSGVTPTEVPQSVRAWMLLQIGAMYENRESVAVGSGIAVADMPFAEHLLDAYRSYL